MKTEVLNKKLKDSGSIICNDSDIITFTFDEVVPSIVIEVRLIEDLQDTSSRISHTIESATKAAVSLYNFNNSLGMGFTSPMHVLNVNGEKRLLTVIVHKVGQNNKLVNYAWYGENL